MKNSAFNSKRFIFYGILLLLFLLLMGLSARVNELNQLTEQYQMMVTDVSALRATNSYLETQVAFASSDEAVDQYAREYGMMVKPAEILVIPISPNKPTPTTESSQVVTIETVPNWRIW